jgi:hypothetical protein
MKKNMGSYDRTTRIVLAVALAVLAFTDVIPGVLGIVALVFAGVFLLTSLVGYCPLYSVFGWSTCETNAKA